MNKTKEIQQLLRESIAIPQERAALFFKTGAGGYADGDQFIGVKVPTLRAIGKQYATLPLADIKFFLQSPINEERSLALFILTNQYAKSDNTTKAKLYQFYLDNMDRVNNWNLVDCSAHLIIGAHLFDKNRDLLITLAQSPTLWERRIAVVATFYFIRNNDCEWTFNIAQLLLNDTHDLIHKAVGWMLREAGKRDQKALETFLNTHAATMPRTMLRYAIEKFSEDKRKYYLMHSSTINHDFSTTHQ